jgi:CBS-domain-containing membrane protein
MRTSPQTCSPTTNLAAVTKLLQLCGCGAVPVIDSDRKLLGIITNRDVCIAVGTKDRRPSELIAQQVMSGEVATCRARDEIHSALRTMKVRKVRQLPVLNQTGELEGILCISDLILDARHNDGNKPPLSYEDVMNTLRSIHWHGAVAPATINASGVLEAPHKTI